MRQTQRDRGTETDTEQRQTRREKDTERDKQRETQRDRDTQRDRQRERERDRGTETDTDIETVQWDDRKILILKTEYLWLSVQEMITSPTRLTQQDLLSWEWGSHTPISPAAWSACKGGNTFVTDNKGR